MKPRKQRFAASDKRKQALKKVLLIDVLFVVVSGLIIALTHKTYLQAVVLGYSVFLIPNLLFCWRVLRRNSVQYVEGMVRSLYAAEVSKFVLTTILFAFSFIVMKPQGMQVAVFFAAYVVLWIVHQLMTYWLVVRNKNR